MVFRLRRTLWLVKDNNQFVSWCKCQNAPISRPNQMDCPWCGCGWLHSCLNCRKSFTFARAVLMEEKIQDLARRDVAIWRPKLDLDSADGKESIRAWTDEMQQLSREVKLGSTYVYFDGHLIPADANGMAISGMHKTHNLEFVPQVRALTDPSARAMLESVPYWNEGAHNS